MERTIYNEYYPDGRLRSCRTEDISRWPEDYSDSDFHAIPIGNELRYRYDYDNTGRAVKLYQYCNNQMDKISEYDYIDDGKPDKR